MITFEVKGAVVRMAKKKDSNWTPEQRAVLAKAKQVTFAHHKSPEEIIRSAVDGGVIAAFGSIEYVLAMCVMVPELFRFETDPDLEEWKKRFPNHKVIHSV